MALDLSRLNRSFGFAFKGIAEIYEREQNIKIELIFAVLIILLGTVLRLGPVEMSVLLICIAQVLSLEVINTAFEIYIDRIVHKNEELIGVVKDLLAGAVLLSVIFSVIVGFLIFYQPLLAMFGF